MDWQWPRALSLLKIIYEYSLGHLCAATSNKIPNLVTRQPVATVFVGGEDMGVGRQA